ncbi:hypothetical protein J6590_016289 [Homalodisca vitripennis]|nr:hypothetical protein J6590_016289 [Homalodisca vitripennis]
MLAVKYKQYNKQAVHSHAPFPINEVPGTPSEELGDGRRHSWTSGREIKSVGKLKAASERGEDFNRRREGNKAYDIDVDFPGRPCVSPPRYIVTWPSPSV